MNTARSVLTKEIWSRRTSKIIVVCIAIIVVVLYALEYSTEHWISPNGKRKAGAILKQAESVRTAPREGFKLVRSTEFPLAGEAGLTSRDNAVIGFAESVYGLAELCRETELNPNPNLGFVPKEGSGDWCKSYESSAKLLHSALASKTGF